MTNIQIQDIEKNIQDHYELANYQAIVHEAKEIVDTSHSTASIKAFYGYALHKLYPEKREIGLNYLITAHHASPQDANIIILIALLQREDPSSTYSSLETFKTAFNIDPQNYRALHHYGVTLFLFGEIELGMRFLEEAVKLSDNDIKVLEDINSLCFYHPNYKNPDYQALALNLHKQFAHLPRYQYSDNDYQVDKQVLHIAFFCSEDTTSITYKFINKVMGILKETAHFQFSFFSRPPNIAAQDTKTIESIKESCENFEFCDNKTIEEIAHNIHSKKIDILVDLGGYSPSFYGYYSKDINSSISIYKPAPVIINWFCYWGTLGISEIDYIITTNENVKPDQQKYFVEKIYRLPNSYTHNEIFDNLPDLSKAPPSKDNGFITFGSFSRLKKFNEYTIETWSKILSQVPNSKLMLKYYYPAKEFVIQNLKAKFKARGIEGDRIIIRAELEDYASFLSAYNEIDIALEPVPFGGITTTINALTMGVPTIALSEDDRCCNGASVDMLERLEMDYCSSRTQEEYVEKAVALANKPELLENLKTKLRDKVRDSSINLDTYVKDIEDAFRNIWVDCCQSFHEKDH